MHAFLHFLQQLFHGQLAKVHNVRNGFGCGFHFSGSFCVYFVFLLFVAFVAQRLAQFAAITVQGIGFKAKFPAHTVALCYFFHRGFVGQVYSFTYGAAKKRLTGSHHADVAIGMDVALSFFAAFVGTIKNGVMRFFQVWCTFNGHGAADVFVGCFYLLIAKAKGFHHVPVPIVVLLGGKAKTLHAGFAKVEFVEGKFDVESCGHASFQLLYFGSVQAFLAQGLVVDERCVLQASAAFGIVYNAFNFLFGIALLSKGFGHTLVDDFEITATAQFLKFHQGKIWFYAGGIAIHNQADGAGGGNYGGLCIAVAIFFTQHHRIVPGFASC